MSVWAVVVAAGRGTRYGAPKQHLELDGTPLWQRCRDTFLRHPSIDGVVVVGDVPDGVPGGDRRRDSVFAGLQRLPENTECVLVHDGARPLVTSSLIDRVLRAMVAGDADGVIPAVPVTDTLKSVASDRVIGTVDRSALVAVQTPQAFRLDVLMSAHRSNPTDDATDDAGLVEAAGGTVMVVPGDPDNVKVTFAGDLELAEFHLRRQADG